MKATGYNISTHDSRALRVLTSPRANIHNRLKESETGFCRVPEDDWFRKKDIFLHRFHPGHCRVEVTPVTKVRSAFGAASLVCVGNERASSVSAQQDWPIKNGSKNTYRSIRHDNNDHFV